MPDPVQQLTGGCRNQMILGGLQTYPRSCPQCGLGPCKDGIVDPFKPIGPPPNTGSGVQPAWPYPSTHPLPPQPTPTAWPTPMGCICPPGANLECQNPRCPRKPAPPLYATGDMPR
jgi:hypothetical protein